MEIKRSVTERARLFATALSSIIEKKDALLNTINPKRFSRNKKNVTGENEKTTGKEGEADGEMDISSSSYRNSNPDAMPTDASGDLFVIDESITYERYLQFVLGNKDNHISSMDSSDKSPVVA
jgi:hypothetical protein